MTQESLVFGFTALEELRKELNSLSHNHVATMNHYASSSGKGFWHQPSNRRKASLSSTATCVSSLTRAGLWESKDKRWGSSEAIAERLLTPPWESAGLPKNNPFSLSFIAEGVLDVIQSKTDPKAEEHRNIVLLEIVPLLLEAIESNDGGLNVPGGVRIAPYPPSAYLTQLAFRVLKRCYTSDDSNFERVTRLVRAWALQEMRRQIVLITTRSRIADPMQLAYAVILGRSASSDERLSPEDKALITSGIRIFFEQQLEDGSWRPSQPLFHYPTVGNAQCFEYELLTQLLICEPLQDELLRYLSKLEKTVRQLSETSFQLTSGPGATALAWASGHHPQIEGPESWSTACVYDFIHALGRLVAEAIRRALFSEVNYEYRKPERKINSGLEHFAPSPGFLDAPLNENGVRKSLRETLWEHFVHPIEKHREIVARGGSLPSETPMSAILFGPPGTSKTQLAKLISKYLGWPLLYVDPSYVIQDGLDQLYAKANKLFSMLALAEEVVVLLDEFDEMGRDRTDNTDLLSRFITTSMLPKLAAINDGRKIVFLLATNYVSNFDAAFSRGGRFDMVAQVMPPSFEAKLANPNWNEVLTKLFAELSGEVKKENEETLADLTFLEVKQVISSLKGDVPTAVSNLRKARDNGTLARANGKAGADGKPASTWKETSQADERAIRLPPLPF